MTRLGLYIAKRRVSDGPRLLTSTFAISFDPIEAYDAPEFFGTLRIAVEACLRPSVTVELSDAWSITREHGITLAQVEGVAIWAAGIERDYVPAETVLAFARKGQYGARIVACHENAAERSAAQQETFFA